MQKINAKITKSDEHGFGSRVETGPVQIRYIGDDAEDELDWPGIFIRGDDALMRYAPALTYLLEHVKVEGEIVSVVSVNVCKNLVKLLQECAVKPKEKSDAEDD